jgi:Asp-tRNA(Asn)/Glu-tRNA(Gln) amidotransferase A subunit family amidase
MKQILIFSPIILMLSCAQEKEPFTREDVQSAQKIIGLQFEGWEIDTMYSYLLRNRRGYDTMRTYTINHEIAPPLLFDPRPDSFVMPESGPDSLHLEMEEVELPGSDAGIAFLPVYKLAALIQSGKMTSSELTRIYLERLKTYGDTLEAVITLTEKTALEQAARADEEIANGKYRGYLHGIPYGIKDLFSYPGYPTTWGSFPYKEQQIEITAAVIERLEHAGAVLIAKLTSGALARGDVWFGGKTRNPWDLNQGSSGSSAGAGAAVAAGLVGFAIGTETLGSIISPSPRCGATGLRPTFGAVSRYGCMALSWSMDKAGPICRHALDCAIVLKAIKGEDIRDRTTRQFTLIFNPATDLGGYKIGYLKEDFERDSSDVSSNKDRTLETLKLLGANLEEVKLPDGQPYQVFDIILRAEAGAFFDELVLSHQDRTMVEQDRGSRANSLRQSRFIPAVEYLQANRHRKKLMEAFHEVIKEYDFIIAPTFRSRQSIITNLTGHPAISVPDGFDEKGNPTSVTLIGNLFDDGKILEAAYIFQKATDFEESHPELFMNNQSN